LKSYTHLVKSTAKELGFDYCGIAKAQKLNEDAVRLETWLRRGFHGSMQYMEEYFDLRVDPTLLVPGAKSVITLMLNYFPSQQQKNTAPKFQSMLLEKIIMK
jgi:epoxyqueuosine reductase